MTTHNRAEMQWGFVVSGPAMTESEVLALPVRLPDGTITTIGAMSYLHFYRMVRPLLSPLTALYKEFETLDLSESLTRWYVVLELVRLRAKLPIVKREHAA